MKKDLRFYIKEGKKRKRLTLKNIDSNISEEKLNAFIEAYQATYQKKRKVKNFKFINKKKK